MKYRCLVLFGVVTAVVAVVSVSWAGQLPRAADGIAAPTKSWTHPRTAWGDPDLQGLWRDRAPVSLERPDQFAGRAFLTDAEMAEKLKTAREGQAERLAGKVTFRAFRAQENYNVVFNTSAEEPRVNRRTSAIIDPPNGRLPPWTLEQVKLWEAREAATHGRGESESVEDVNVQARCIPHLAVATVGAWGLGTGGNATLAGQGTDAGDRIVSSGGAKWILQAPGYVAIVGELGDHFIVPLDRRPQPGPKIRQWMGVQRGHWEGNTLVVESTNIRYADSLVIPNAGFAMYPGTAETLKVTERFTRVGADNLDYRYTVEDPAVYTQPYTVINVLDRGDNYKMVPNMCHENNRDLNGAFANARGDEKQALENGAKSVSFRKQRIERLNKEAEEAAAKQSSRSRR